MFKNFHPSIRNRMMLTVIVGLISLIAVHLSVNYYYVQAIYDSERDRLDKFSREYVKSFSLDEEGKLKWVNTKSPDVKFDSIGSGLYAKIFDGEQVVWSSPSLIGTKANMSIPENIGNNNGRIFSSGDSTKSNNLYKFYTPILISNLEANDEKLFYILIAENGTMIDVKIETLKSNIWYTLIYAFLFILIAQSIAGHWVVRPLTRLNKEIKKIRSGEQKNIIGEYPKELNGVTNGFNKMLEHEAKQVESYRNSLANLAHSLKTPLAVLNTSMENESDINNLKKEMSDQLKKMSDMVSYQLSLAARSGRQTFIQPMEVEPLCLEIVESLEKLHKDKKAYCEFEIDEGLTVRANRGDMQELFGNLLENAFKWCKNRVILTIHEDVVEQELTIVVEDDGVGVPADKVNEIINRGVRADEHVHGHGIGLAIVKDIVNSYKGTMEITRSETIGGALFKIKIPM